MSFKMVIIFFIIFITVIILDSKELTDVTRSLLHNLRNEHKIFTPEPPSLYNLWTGVQCFDKTLPMS